MVEVTKLNLTVREKVGTNAARKLRKEGRVPVNLYGHGQPAASLSVDRKDLENALARHAQFLELSVGDSADTAVIREVQFDTYGQHVMHIEFERANIDEAIVVSLPIELRGRPKGLADGGILDRLMDHLEVKIAPRHMPESLEVNVSELGLGDSIDVGSIQLPPGAELEEDPEKLVCIMLQPRVQAEAAEEGAAEGAEGAEPEVVGEKKSDEEPAD